jgi:hypothetical protein
MIGIGNVKIFSCGCLPGIHSQLLMKRFYPGQSGTANNFLIGNAGCPSVAFSFNLMDLAEYNLSIGKNAVIRLYNMIKSMFIYHLK